MRLLVDVLQCHGWEAVHWSNTGSPRAPDAEIMAWAILAATNARGPSVFQVRTQDVSPAHLEPMVAAALRQYATALEEGALVTVDEARSRVRILPMMREGRRPEAGELESRPSGGLGDDQRRDETGVEVDGR